ncbi:MAG: HD-GYP domain-containing protein [Lachnospiraceae bacterium]|jgi:putative nucleotidyltransferase with HDIG domain|nr:HD-GYP domain-containing protein [Lachnospiraceae bacterium]
MRRIRTSDLVPGMTTAEDVYSYNNQLVVPNNTVLTDKMITRLEFYSVLAVRVKDEEVKHADEISPFDLPSYSERIKASKEFKEFERTFIATTENFKQNLRSIVDERAPINTEELFDHISNLMTAQSSTISIFDMLHNMRQYDDMTYAHSINVGLICNVFAKWLKLPPSEVEKLTLCGLMHDIGKLVVPDKIIRKPDKLTPNEYNIIKTHTLQGYKILKEYENINDDVKEAALMHHERCDGTGYPLGLTGDKINKYAKIVAIADVYDAMTAARVYRGPLCPFKVIGIFESEGLNKYDSHFILIFLEHIASTYIKNRVRLSNGMEGEVVFMNKTALSRPMIQCRNRFVDLSKETDIYIETFV